MQLGSFDLVCLQLDKCGMFYKILQHLDAILAKRNDTKCGLEFSEPPNDLKLAVRGLISARYDFGTTI